MSTRAPQSRSPNLETASLKHWRILLGVSIDTELHFSTAIDTFQTQITAMDGIRERERMTASTMQLRKLTPGATCRNLQRPCMIHNEYEEGVHVRRGSA